ncbi:dihydrofolate reductase family protein [Gordonia sp. (in: high G+C Gram-positive bacteria)]|uniref:dihydrofolate reductase family protein n=1 Tax=Gordonia sp. (in: high G+C Gram-positive bacteria) TaxID=84139 RepID=UPI003528BDBA
MKKATEVTTPTPAGDDDLAAWLREQYAYPDDRPWLRANMVASIDGAATLDGRSGGLGSPGDRLLFSVLRQLADAVVVGAHTALTEGYRVPESDGDSPAPALVLASRSLSIPDDYVPAFAPGTLIATCTAAPAAERARLVAGGAALIDCGDDEVDPRRLTAELAARGHRKLICEGGPRLLASLVAAGALDQLAVTLAPALAGGDGPRIAHGDTPPGGLRHARLAQLIGDDDGYLYFLWNTGTGEARGARAGMP